MGCDRNLFTLRLVLNQTWGEWQWQVGWGAGAAKKTARVCHVAQVQHYNPPPPHPPQGKGSSPRPSRWIEGWREGASKGMYEENKRWVMHQRQDSLSHAPDGMIIKYSREPRWIMLPPFCKMHCARQPSSQSVSQSGRQAGRQEAGSHRLGRHSLQTAGENGKRSKDEARSKLALAEKSRRRIICHILCFPSLIGVWPVM